MEDRVQGLIRRTAFCGRSARCAGFCAARIENWRFFREFWVVFRSPWGHFKDLQRIALARKSLFFRDCDHHSIVCDLRGSVLPDALDDKGTMKKEAG